MKRLLPLLAAVAVSGLTGAVRGRAGEAQDRRADDAVRPAGRARHAAAQRLPARRQAARRQARRPRSRADRCRTTSSSPTSPSTKAKALVERDKVDFVVGPVFSNILGAMMKPVDRRRRDPDLARTPAPRTSPARTATPNFFVTSYQNDQNHEVLGKYAQDTGIKKVVHHGAELPGRQGLARRLQALLQGRGGRRSLRAAEPARLLGRAVQDRGVGAPRRSSCSCPAAWA